MLSTSMGFSYSNFIFVEKLANKTELRQVSKKYINQLHRIWWEQECWESNVNNVLSTLIPFIVKKPCCIWSVYGLTLKQWFVKLWHQSRWTILSTCRLSLSPSRSSSSHLQMIKLNKWKLRWSNCLCRQHSFDIPLHWWSAKYDQHMLYLC